MKKFKLNLLENTYLKIVDEIKENQRRETERVGLLPEAVIIDLFEDIYGMEEFQYSIDIGDITGYHYHDLEEAQHDFNLLIKRMRKEAVYVEFTEHLDDQYEWIDAVNNLKDNPDVLVELTYVELQRQYESGDHTAIVELLKFVPKENLVGFLSEDMIMKLS